MIWFLLTGNMKFLVDKLLEKKTEFSLTKKLICEQARNQEYFRAGEFSWN